MLTMDIKINSSLLKEKGWLSGIMQIEAMMSSEERMIYETFGGRDTIINNLMKQFDSDGEEKVHRICEALTTTTANAYGTPSLVKYITIISSVCVRRCDV